MQVAILRNFTSCRHSLIRSLDLGQRRLIQQTNVNDGQPARKVIILWTQLWTFHRDGEVPSQKELSSYFEELFSSNVPHQKELSSSNEELFPNPDLSTGRVLLNDHLIHIRKEMF